MSSELRRAKIVATVGPASTGEERLRELIDAGVDVFRLNFSHGDADFHRARTAEIRRCADTAGRPVGILGDLSGPKIRVGELAGGSCELVAGSEVVLAPEPARGSVIPHTYDRLARDVEPGDPIFFDDGKLCVEVVAIDDDDVCARVRAGGVLRSHKGINLPASELSAPALTAKDRSDLELARELGLDFLALSFVRSPGDVTEAKRLAGETPVIAKVERPEAVDRLEDILDVADGVMVARGDLGVEIGHERVPAIQKRIIREAVRRSIPVITATQMLESMVSSRQPTRAEVSDVANAVLDGTDAVMLSGETAVGSYPVETVRMMASIIREAEGSVDRDVAFRSLPEVSTRTFSSAIAAAAVEVSETLGLSAIAVYSESGASAADVSSLRPKAEVIAFSRHDSVLHELTLYWGVRPIFGEWVEGVAGVVEQAERELLAHRLVAPGDNIAITFCKRLGDEPFQTNIMKLWRIRERSGDLQPAADPPTREPAS